MATHMAVYDRIARESCGASTPEEVDRFFQEGVFSLPLSRQAEILATLLAANDYRPLRIVTGSEGNASLLGVGPAAPRPPRKAPPPIREGARLVMDLEDLADRRVAFLEGDTEGSLTEAINRVSSRDPLEALEIYESFFRAQPAVSQTLKDWISNHTAGLNISAADAGTNTWKGLRLGADDVLNLNVLPAIKTQDS